MSTAVENLSPNKRMIQGVLSNDCMAVVDAIADGADPLRETVKDVTVFALALRMGYIDIVAAMLHAGAAVDYQQTPLHRTALSYAVEADMDELGCKRTTLLLGYGANPDVTFSYDGKRGCTVDVLLERRAAEAMPPEEVTIADLRELIAARREVLSRGELQAMRREKILGTMQGRKYKL